MIIGIAGYPHQIHTYEAALQYSTDFEVACSLSANSAQNWDALLLPGGGDISPALLPQPPMLHAACQEPDNCLDQSQMELLDLFVRQKKPILGISKGMQLINLYFGGNLCQHLPGADKHLHETHDLYHPAYTKPGTFLYSLYGPRTIINSAHHQGIPDNPAFLGKNITAIQRSADGIVEAIKHDFLPIIGLQWHPERLCGRFHNPDAADGSLIFQYFQLSNFFTARD